MDVIDSQDRVATLGERNVALEAALRRFVRAVRLNHFIIPKDGESRDICIAALDEAKILLELKGSEGGE